MPGGKTHDKFNIIVLFIILLGLFPLLERPLLPFPESYLESRRITVFSLAYLFGTFFLSPDLDIKSGPYRRWGALKVIWRPYQRLFGHRGVLHHPVFGPIILSLTLAFMLYFPLALLDLGVNRIPVESADFAVITRLKALLDLGTNLPPVWAGVAALLGLVLSMEVHYLLDFIWGKVRFLK
ncbi:DUF2227 family putative metal-binding protein [Methanosarcina sp. KYL-1]|uniref:DUF2227 family putative metal-binding protein n=1 Tax=Methanosarcina sp. KYL-1 TaxID=2602068 RepID=UPI002101390A|nr:DUF2227 family putative metal-binding protein [Methanosarcina sp. KYL-1]